MRQRLSLDRNWRFSLTTPELDLEFARDRALVKSGEGRGAASPKFDDSKWQVVNVPHDWAIDLPLVRSDDREVVEHAFRAIGPEHPKNSVGWYRRTFDIPKSDLGRRISVEFDGVFRDSIVWINGHRLGRHPSGHTSFRYDLTDMLHYGEANVLSVRVDATSWEGWWYEGAGIYRHVWLVKTSPVHVGHWGTQVIASVGGDTKGRRDEARTKKAIVVVRTTVVNDGDERVVVKLKSEIAGAKSRTTSNVRIEPWSQVEVEQKVVLTNVKLWSPAAPNLYKLVSTIDGHDRFETTFGIRTLKWDARRGFFLNGKHLKIKGTCNHQNHAGVGTAMPDKLHEWRVRKLKEMGSNAYRCSHYAATPELLDICDRLGMLVMAENRLAGSGPEFMDDFKSMIVRDRNHPSIFLWSIGNEEHTIQWKIAGERIGRTLVRTAHELDPTRKVTCAMHDRGLGEGFANIVDVHGWNYIHVGDIEAFHKRRPEQPIVGSEEGSTVTTRGEYADDSKRGYVSAYDLRAPKWGATAETWWKFFAERPWLAGGFVWTGFDYRGEPIPYKWPCTSSHFGLMDLCGFPKDLYWYYLAWWTDEPVLHVFPHWNWSSKRTEPIDVRCFSNCDEVELFVNDRSHGRKSVVRNSHVAWSVRYEPGTLEARGFRNGRLLRTTFVQTTGTPVRIAIDPGCTTLDANGEDIALLAISALDRQGRPVPTASNRVHFEIRGDGRLLGVGNGDPSSHETDHANFRRLFNGLAMLIVQSTRRSGAINIVARSKGLRPARVTIQTRPCRMRPSVDP